MELEKKLKLSGIFFLLVGLVMVVYGFSRGEGGAVNPLYWITCSTSLLIGSLNFFSKKNQKFSIVLSRVLLGSLFVVSGLIKANDPMGFSFKLEEYFEPEALGWTAFHGTELWLSILIAGAEILLGLAVVFGALLRLSSWLLLGMIGFFAWLTFYTANCNETEKLHNNYAQVIGYGDGQVQQGNLDSARVEYELAATYFQTSEIDNRLKISEGVDAEMTEINPFPRKCVKECGCFGDALKGSIGRSLTPWESFYKDMVLLVLVINILMFSGSVGTSDFKEDVILNGGMTLFAILLGGWLFGWWFPVTFCVVLSAVFMLVKYRLKSKYTISMTALLSTVASFGFAIYSFMYLPSKDYLPYGVGDDLSVNRLSVDEYNAMFGTTQVAPVHVYNWRVKNLLDGTEEVMRSDRYVQNKVWEDSTKKLMLREDDGRIINYESIQLSGGYETLITDLAIQANMKDVPTSYLEDEKVKEEIEFGYDPGYSEKYYKFSDLKTGEEFDLVYYNWSQEAYPDTLFRFIMEFDSVVSPEILPSLDITDLILKEEKVLWIVSYDYEKCNMEALESMMPLIESARNDGVFVHLLAAYNEAQIAELRDKLRIDVPVYTADGIELKKVVRSNPGVVYLNSGEVMGKYSYYSIPKFEDIK